MYYSFGNTVVNRKIFVGLDENDPELKKYLNLSGPAIKCKVYPSKTTITEIFNDVLKNYQYDYYHLTNDDFIYKTENWDEILIKEIEDHGGVGIAYGNDLFQGENKPTAPVISGNVARALGWLQYPKLQHLYGDSVWKVIGDQANCSYFRGDVEIEHCHVLRFPDLEDATYEKTNDKELYQRDKKAFIEWLQYHSQDDINKVKALMERK